MKHFFNFNYVRCEKCGRFYYGRETLICVKNKHHYRFILSDNEIEIKIIEGK